MGRRKTNFKLVELHCSGLQRFKITAKFFLEKNSNLKSLKFKKMSRLSLKKAQVDAHECQNGIFHDDKNPPDSRSALKMNKI